MEDMPNQTEILVQEAKENQTRKILAEVKECKDLDEAIAKIASMIKN